MTAVRFKIIVTDGVFSMDGLVAPLDKICDLAEKYDALVMIDECHAAVYWKNRHRHFRGEKCSWSYRHLNRNIGWPLAVYGRYTTGKKEIIEMLRQRSRPYLFSNSLAPALVGASIKVFDLLSNDTSLRDKLEENTTYFKKPTIS